MPDSDSERTDRPAIALIGAPTDVGAGHRGGSMGPEALRVAGLAQGLRRLGYRVTDQGNLAGPPNPEAEPVGGYRHLAEVAQWCLAAREATYGALAAGTLPVLLGGDHALSIGSIAGVARHCAERRMPLAVLWLDAHADFNTRDTTPTGNIHGMPVAVLTGHGPPELTGLLPAGKPLDAAQIFQLGVRSVDHVEKSLVVESGLVVVDMRQIDERGMRAVMDEVLGQLAALGGHLHVSLDVDFLDPVIAPGVATCVPGGPNYREAQLCMEMIHDSGLMRSLDIVELNPAWDDHNRTAALVVELAQSLFGQQILNRRQHSL